MKNALCPDLLLQQVGIVATIVVAAVGKVVGCARLPILQSGQGSRGEIFHVDEGDGLRLEAHGEVDPHRNAFRHLVIVVLARPVNARWAQDNVV